MKKAPFFTIPEAFRNALELNHLPLPPLPGLLLPRLRQVDEYVFSTRPSRLPVAGGRLCLPEAPWSGESCFACGLVGYGLQNWHYCYALHTRSLELTTLVPYPGVFGAGRGMEVIPHIHALIHACLGGTRCGERLGRPGAVRMRVTLDGDDFAFGLYDKEGVVLHEGARPESLLDMLAQWARGSVPTPADYA